MLYRQAIKSDISSMSRIRASEWQTEDYWNSRIAEYMNNSLHPQQALSGRIIYVAEEGNVIAGFIAGHLTTRFECDGELQWINVAMKFRRRGIATELLLVLGKWFLEQKAFRICVDPDNEDFYRKNGAKNLNDHWLFWEDIRVIL